MSPAGRKALRGVAAAFAAAAFLHGAVSAGHESNRSRFQATERAGIAAADAAQSRHEFVEARRQLDHLLADNPRDVEARLMSANLFQLAGDFERARGECRLVLDVGELHAGTICLAAALTGPGSVDRARRMIGALGAAQHSSLDLNRWRLLTEADLALRAGDIAAAVVLHERAYALDPAHEEARTRLAELLLDRGEAARALELARAPDPGPARLVIRLRAAKAVADADVAPSFRDLLAALEADRSENLPPHLREEAQIALYVDRDPVTALRLAKLNFATQKDTPDLRMLANAAVAAADAAALDAIRAWMRETGFEDRQVEAKLGA